MEKLKNIITTSKKPVIPSKLAKNQSQPGISQASRRPPQKTVLSASKSRSNSGSQNNRFQTDLYYKSQNSPKPPNIVKIQLSGNGPQKVEITPRKMLASKKYSEMGGMAEDNIGLNTILEDSKLSGALGDSHVVYSAKKEDRRTRASRGQSSDSNTNLPFGSSEDIRGEKEKGSTNYSSSQKKYPSSSQLPSTSGNIPPAYSIIELKEKQINAIEQINQIDNQFEKSLSEEGNLTPPRDSVVRDSVVQSEPQRSHTHSKPSSDQDKELLVKNQSSRSRPVSVFTGESQRDESPTSQFHPSFPDNRNPIMANFLPVNSGSNDGPVPAGIQPISFNISSSNSGQEISLTLQQQIREFQEFQAFKQSKQYQEYQQKLHQLQFIEQQNQQKANNKQEEMQNRPGINKPDPQSYIPGQNFSQQMFNNSLNQNSYMKNLMETKIQQNETSLNESSRSIEQQTLNFSQHSHQEKFSCCNLIEIVNKMKRFQLQSQKQVRDHFLNKGMRLFFELNENLNAYKQGFDKQKVLSDEYSSQLYQKNGEKFEFSPKEAFDFRQWEQYDIIEFEKATKVDRVKDIIPQIHIPKYIIDDISNEKNPELNLQQISSFKSGIKIGSKLSNTSQRWIEKWFEIHCRDQKIKSSKSVNIMNENHQIIPADQDIILRYYSKIWVNPGENILEGESCLALLIDGATHGVEDALAFELKENFKSDNILRNTIRKPKIHFMQCYLTEYDQSIFKIKVKDDGVEHKWSTFPEHLAHGHIKMAHQGSIIQTSVWQTLFQMDGQYIKEIIYRDPSKQNDHLGFKEGKNELSQIWKEDWQKNEIQNFYRWNNYTEENKDGYVTKWGQWQESKKGDYVAGEKWCEVYNTQYDYWERKAQKYTNHVKNSANIIDVVLLKSGINEFRNNKNFSDVEEWKEYSDGMIIKKKINDNGYGRRIRAETGQKLHREKLKHIRRVSAKGDNGHTEEILLDEEGYRLKSLQEYLDKPNQILEFQYQKELIDDPAQDLLVEIKKGRSFMSEEEWADSIDDPENEQRWIKKNGKLWKEQWYNRIKELPRGSEEANNTFSQQKFQNLNMSLDSQRANISRMSDKWVVDLEKGQFKGQTWGNTYEESQKVKDVFSLKWDERHAKYGSGNLEKK